MNIRGNYIFVVCYNENGIVAALVTGKMARLRDDLYRQRDIFLSVKLPKSSCMRDRGRFVFNFLCDRVHTLCLLTLGQRRVKMSQKWHWFNAGITGVGQLSKTTLSKRMHVCLVYISSFSLSLSLSRYPQPPSRLTYLPFRSTSTLSLHYAISHGVFLVVLQDKVPSKLTKNYR